MNIMSMLVEERPTTSDMESNTYYCTTLASGLVALRKKDIGMMKRVLPSVTAAILIGCDAEFIEVHSAVGSALKRIIGGCIEENMIREAMQERSVGASTFSTALNLFIVTLEGVMQLRYQGTWLYVMDSMRSLFDSLNQEHASLLLMDTVVKLAEIFQAVEGGRVEVMPGVQVAVADTMGSALKSFGLVRFLSVVPLRLHTSPEYIGVDDEREWLLTLLHSNLKLMHCDVSEFGQTILTAARSCSSAIKASLQGGVGAPRLTDQQREKMRKRVLQLWSLFPASCYIGPRDIPQSFPKLAPILAGAMKDNTYPELLGHIIIGLANIAKGARTRCPVSLSLPPSPGSTPSHVDSSEVQTLQSHASTFLPLLLSSLETLDIGDIRFQNGVVAIAAWAAIAPKSLVTNVAKKLLQMLLASTGEVQDPETNARAAGWMSVVLSIVPYLQPQMILLLYKTIRPLLSVGESLSLQKRAYLVLDSLLQTHGDLLHDSEPRY